MFYNIGFSFLEVGWQSKQDFSKLIIHLWEQDICERKKGCSLVAECRVKEDWNLGEHKFRVCLIPIGNLTKSRP